MRTLLPLLILAPGAALAHVGYLGEVAGHDHWVAVAGLGAAAAIAIWAALKGKGERPRDEPEDAAPDEAEA